LQVVPLGHGNGGFEELRTALKAHSGQAVWAVLKAFGVDQAGVFVVYVTKNLALISSFHR
jgi:hypothetical protein